uniref:DNA repair photolyase n=1 Tax=Desulfovibrio sp. U5L TaxID=596152 RepID=I2Q4G9_9BACT
MVKIVARKSAITRSPEFEKKTLATHALNVGVLCGHGCLYCSTPAILRTQSKLFPEYDGSAFKAFAAGAAVVDPTTPDRLGRELAALKPTDTVMLSTLTDAWSPEAQEHDLGRRCLEKLLRESKARVRILTKNAAVVNELDLLAEFRERLVLGLSITAPLSKAKVADVLEPRASPILARLEALKAAHEAKVPIFGMLCPCLPGVADRQADLDEMFAMIQPFNPEAIWSEPVNPRGPGLRLCQEALAEAGFIAIANEVSFIRSQREHTAYVARLISNLHAAAASAGVKHLLKILVYADGNQSKGDDSAVIWLKS